MQEFTQTITLSGGICATVEVSTYGKTTVTVFTPEGSRVFTGYSEAEALEQLRLGGFTIVEDVSTNGANEEIYQHILSQPGPIEGALWSQCVTAVAGEIPHHRQSPDHHWPWNSNALHPSCVDMRAHNERSLLEWAIINNDFNPDFNPGFMGEHC